MACDICGKNDCKLVDLLKTYQTEEIKQICVNCEKVVNDHLYKVRKLTHGILGELIKNFMRERKSLCT